MSCWKWNTFTNRGGLISMCSITFNPELFHEHLCIPQPPPPPPFTDIHYLFTLDFTVGSLLWPWSSLFDAGWNQPSGSPKHSKVDEFILPPLWSSTTIQKKTSPKTGKSQSLQHFRLQSQYRLIQSIQESYVLQCTWIFFVCVCVFFFEFAQPFVPFFLQTSFIHPYIFLPAVCDSCFQDWNRTVISPDKSKRGKPNRKKTGPLTQRCQVAEES